MCALSDAQNISLWNVENFPLIQHPLCPFGLFNFPCLVCPVPQTKDLSPGAGWFQCSQDVLKFFLQLGGTCAAMSPLWPCPAEPGGDGEQPFPAPPCQWEDFCHRLDGCRMETLIFKEGMTQISKSYRPWNKLLFLAFEAFWYGKTQFHCKIFQSTKLLPKFLLPQSAVSHTCDGHSSQTFKLPLWTMEMKVMSEHIIPFLVGAWEYLLWPDTCTADVDVWWWRHSVPCLFTPAITNYKRNEWVF